MTEVRGNHTSIDSQLVVKDGAVTSQASGLSRGAQGSGRVRVGSPRLGEGGKLMVVGVGVRSARAEDSELAATHAGLASEARSSELGARRACVVLE